MQPIQLSTEIAPVAWGESSRNVPKILDILNAGAIRAGIYAPRPAGPDGPMPDQLVAIVSRWRLLELRVGHPEDKQRRGFLRANGAFTEAPAWYAFLEDGTCLGTNRDPAIACGLITGITGAEA